MSVDGDYERTINELVSDKKRLEQAFRDMPAIELQFMNKKDFDAWNEWKAKYFDKDGVFN